MKGNEHLIGRQLHYHASPFDPGSHKGVALQSATVAGVNEDGTLNLCILDNFGNTYARQRIPLIQGGDEAPEYEYATWPIQAPLPQEPVKAKTKKTTIPVGKDNDI